MSRFGGWLAERRATRVALIAALFPLLPILSSGVAVFDAIARGWRTAVLDCLIALGLLIAVTLLLGGDWQQILIGAGMVWSIAIGGGYLVGAFGSLTLPVQVLVMLGVIGVIAFYAAVSDSVAFWETGLTWFAEQLQQSGYPVADTSVLHPIATVMTGVAGALWVLTATVGLLLGSWWASGAGGPGFREMFLSLRMGYVIGGLAALAGIGSLVGGSGRSRSLFA